MPIRFLILLLSLRPRIQAVEKVDIFIDLSVPMNLKTSHGVNHSHSIVAGGLLEMS